MPVRPIRASAPVRVCDAGGWTDTWFAGHGRVCSVAVAPRAEVELTLQDAPGTVTLDVADYGHRYSFDPHDPPGRHRLLEACVAEAPPPSACTISLHCDMPAGSGTGTSASVSVALLGALTAARGDPADPHRIAAAAHHVETRRLGMQSGVQDQLAAAFGGVNLIEMYEYPYADVIALPVGEQTLRAVQSGLVLVYLGRSHVSSDVHDLVIGWLQREGSESALLQNLRDAADAARGALVDGDLQAYGRALAANTDAQARLHPALVNPTARDVISLGRRHGAIGWKVNGAGGDGGSVCVLFEPGAPGNAAFQAGLASVPGGCRIVELSLSPDGLRVEG